MNRGRNQNSRTISKSVYAQSMSEPVIDEPAGIYIGKTLRYKIPFYLDWRMLINSHVTAIGMSGAGKSYFVKNMLARCVSREGARMLVIDWNNEYCDLISFTGGRALSLGKDFRINILGLYKRDPDWVPKIVQLISDVIRIRKSDARLLQMCMLDLGRSRNGEFSLRHLIECARGLGDMGAVLADSLGHLEGNPLFAPKTDFDMKKIFGGVYSIDISALKGNVQRGEVIRFVLRMVVEQMHSLGLDSQTRRILVMDEAWRFIKGSEEIGTLFREGRKYGVSVVAATQMASDINNEVMANAGCVAIFRLQSEQDYQILEDIGIAGVDERRQIGDLKMGRCMLSLAYKSAGSLPRRFFIDKVSGIDFGTVAINCGSMKRSIGYSRFVRITSEVVRPPIREKIISYITDNARRIEASAFISYMLGLGMHREEIVTYLRELGLDDISIVVSYENAQFGS